MNEYLEIIKNAFLNYYANQKYFIIFLIALLFIFVKEKNKMNKNFLLYYPIIVYIVVLNPVFVAVLLKIIPNSIYCRFFWTIPLGMIMAYFGVELISGIEEKFKKKVAVVAFLLILIYSGTYMYTNPNFEKTIPINKAYKLPDEYVQITQKIANLPIEEKKAMTSTNMIGYIRQIDASIKLAYPRIAYGDYENRYPIVKVYNQGDVENLVSLCQVQNINIIVYDKSISLTMPPSNYGYNLYDQTENYDIYVLQNSQE